MPEDKFNELYSYLKSEKMTDLDSKSFYDKYSSDSKSFSELYGYMKKEKLTDLDENAFRSEYFGVKKKVTPQGDQPENQPQNINSLGGSPSGQQLLTPQNLKFPAPMVNSPLSGRPQPDLTSIQTGGYTWGGGNIQTPTTLPTSQETYTIAETPQQAATVNQQIQQRQQQELELQQREEAEVFNVIDKGKNWALTQMPELTKGNDWYFDPKFEGIMAEYLVNIGIDKEKVPQHLTAYKKQFEKQVANDMVADIVNYFGGDTDKATSGIISKVEEKVFSGFSQSSIELGKTNKELQDKRRAFNQLTIAINNNTETYNQLVSAGKTQEAAELKKAIDEKQVEKSAYEKEIRILADKSKKLQTGKEFLDPITGDKVTDQEQLQYIQQQESAYKNQYSNTTADVLQSELIKTALLLERYKSKQDFISATGYRLPNAAEGNNERLSGYAIDKSLRDNIYSLQTKFNVLGELLYLNKSPEQVEKDLGFHVLSAVQGLTSGISGITEIGTSTDLGATGGILNYFGLTPPTDKREWLDMVQQISNDTGIKLTKEEEANIEQGVGEITSQMIGGAIPIAIQFALFNKAVGATKAEAMVANYATKLFKSEKIGALIGNSVAQGVVMEMAGGTFGQGVGFAVGGNIPIPISPALKPIIAKFLSALKTGVSIETGSQAGLMIQAMTDELMGNKDFMKSMDEHYGQYSDFDKRLIAGLIANTLTFGMMHKVSYAPLAKKQQLETLHAKFLKNGDTETAKLLETEIQRITKLESDMKESERMAKRYEERYKRTGDQNDFNLYQAYAENAQMHKRIFDNTSIKSPQELKESNAEYKAVSDKINKDKSETSVREAIEKNVVNDNVKTETPETIVEKQTESAGKNPLESIIGEQVSYGDIDGTIIRSKDGIFYIKDSKGKETIIESGESGKSLQELGIKVATPLTEKQISDIARDSENILTTTFNGNEYVVYTANPYKQNDWGDIIFAVRKDGSLVRHNYNKLKIINKALKESGIAERDYVVNRQKGMVDKTKTSESAVGNIEVSPKQADIKVETPNVDVKPEEAQKEIIQPTETKPIESADKPTETYTPQKERFTESKDLNRIYSDMKKKYGDKEAAKIYEAANRLVNPNKNEIVEIRSNGVVVKEGDKYILKPFGNTDANSKKWTLYKGLDVTAQFETTKTEAPKEPTKETPSESAAEKTPTDVEKPKEMTLGDMIRQYKSDGKILNDPILGLSKAVWDGLLESVALLVDAGQAITTAVRNAMKQYQDSDWYKSKSAEEKKKLEDEISKKLLGNVYINKDLSKNEIATIPTLASEKQKETIKTNVSKRTAEEDPLLKVKSIEAIKKEAPEFSETVKDTMEKMIADNEKKSDVKEKVMDMVEKSEWIGKMGDVPKLIAKNEIEKEVDTMLKEVYGTTHSIESARDRIKENILKDEVDKVRNELKESAGKEIADISQKIADYKEQKEQLKGRENTQQRKEVEAKIFEAENALDLAERKLIQSVLEQGAGENSVVSQIKDLIPKESKRNLRRKVKEEWNKFQTAQSKKFIETDTEVISTSRIREQVNDLGSAFIEGVKIGTKDRMETEREIMKEINNIIQSAGGKSALNTTAYKKLVSGIAKTLTDSKKETIDNDLSKVKASVIDYVVQLHAENKANKLVQKFDPNNYTKVENGQVKATRGKGVDDIVKEANKIAKDKDYDKKLDDFSERFMNGEASPEEIISFQIAENIRNFELAMETIRKPLPVDSPTAKMTESERIKAYEVNKIAREESISDKMEAFSIVNGIYKQMKSIDKQWIADRNQKLKEKQEKKEDIANTIVGNGKAKKIEIKDLTAESIGLIESAGYNEETILFTNDYINNLKQLNPKRAKLFEKRLIDALNQNQNMSRQQYSDMVKKIAKDLKLDSSTFQDWSSKYQRRPRLFTISSRFETLENLLYTAFAVKGGDSKMFIKKNFIEPLDLSQRQAEMYNLEITKLIHEAEKMIPTDKVGTRVYLNVKHEKYGFNDLTKKIKQKDGTYKQVPDNSLNKMSLADISYLSTFLKSQENMEIQLNHYTGESIIKLQNRVNKIMNEAEGLKKYTEHWENAIYPKLYEIADRTYFNIYGTHLPKVNGAFVPRALAEHINRINETESTPLKNQDQKSLYSSTGHIKQRIKHTKELAWIQENIGMKYANEIIEWASYAEWQRDVIPILKSQKVRDLLNQYSNGDKIARSIDLLLMNIPKVRTDIRDSRNVPMVLVSKLVGAALAENPSLYIKQLASFTNAMEQYKAEGVHNWIGIKETEYLYHLASLGKSKWSEYTTEFFNSAFANERLGKGYSKDMWMALQTPLLNLITKEGSAMSLYSQYYSKWLSENVGMIAVRYGDIASFMGYAPNYFKAKEMIKAENPNMPETELRNRALKQVVTAAEKVQQSRSAKDLTVWQLTQGYKWFGSFTSANVQFQNQITDAIRTMKREGLSNNEIRRVYNYAIIQPAIYNLAGIVSTGLLYGKFFGKKDDEENEYIAKMNTEYENIKDKVGFKNQEDPNTLMKAMSYMLQFSSNFIQGVPIAYNYAQNTALSMRGEKTYDVTYSVAIEKATMLTNLLIKPDKTEKQWQELGKLLFELSGHSIKNPERIVKGWAKAMKDEPPKNMEQIQKEINAIDKSRLQ